MPDTRDVSSVLFGRREVVVPTEADDFRYLRWHGGTAYTIVCPSQDDDTWKAIALWGNHDQLVADTADGLLAVTNYGVRPV